MADMLEHADGDDAIEAALELAVVLEQDLDRQPLAAPTGQLRLLPGDGDAGDLDAVMPRGVLGEAAPAAADVQHPHAGLQLELAAGELELAALGLQQAAGVLPVAAGVAHGVIEHAFEEVVAEVVVGLADDMGAGAALQVEETGLEAIHQSF